MSLVTLFNAYKYVKPLINCVSHFEEANHFFSDPLYQMNVPIINLPPNQPNWAIMGAYGSDMILFSNELFFIALRVYGYAICFFSNIPLFDLANEINSMTDFFTWWRLGGHSLGLISSGYLISYMHRERMSVRVCMCACNIMRIALPYFIPSACGILVMSSFLAVDLTCRIVLWWRR